MPAFISTFIYSLLAGLGWSLFFKRRFLESLAPAFIAHSLLVMFSGMITGNLLPGLVGGILLMLLGLSYRLYRTPGSERLSVLIRTPGKQDLILFLILFFFLWLTSIGKQFTSWDEWSHWGRFWKECLRLDALYVTSDANMAHRDYVPGVTLFEYIWSRLSFRLVEADAYRAQEFIMMAMELPILCAFLEKDKKPDVHYIMKAMAAVTIVLAVPLFFVTDLNFAFYHTLYNDYIFGVVLFYAFWMVFQKEKDHVYHLLISTLAITFLAVIKMTAIAFVPMVIPVFWVAKLLLDRETASEEEGGTKKNIPGKALSLLIPMVVPVLVWSWYNAYARHIMGVTLASQAGGQSYGKLDLALVFNVFFHPEKTDISFIDTVRTLYGQVIWTYPVMLQGSYMGVLIAVSLLIVGIAIISRYLPVTMEGITQALSVTEEPIRQEKKSKKKSAAVLKNEARRLDKKRKEEEKALEKKLAGKRMVRILLCALWVFLAGVANALLMYYLYCTSFSEYEATNLASYTRYMNTYLVAAVLVLVAVWFSTGVASRFFASMAVIWVILAVDLLIHPDAFNQILPGTLTGDYELTKDYREMEDLMEDYAGVEDSIYILTRGDNGYITTIMGYFMLPRDIGGGSIGTAVYEGDIWSRELSAEEFAAEVAEYDWIYLNRVDEMFYNTYASVFTEECPVANGALYHVRGLDEEKGNLKLELP